MSKRQAGTLIAHKAVTPLLAQSRQGNGKNLAALPRTKGERGLEAVLWVHSCFMNRWCALDRITESQVREFLETSGIPSVDESSDFEAFVNYAVVSNEHSESVDVDDVNVGSGGDTGLDGIAIIVNGRIITTSDEVDDLRKINGYLDVDFIFTQAKTSDSFDLGQILKFCNGVEDFFAKSPRLGRNEMVASRAQLASHIFAQGGAMTQRLPRVKAVYVTTGTWLAPSDLVAVLDKLKADLLGENLFSDVQWQALGAREIQRSYLETKEPTKATIEFQNRVTLPSINGVTQAYLGTIPFSEFKKLIVATSGDINLPVFYDNVRAFQGSNPVNRDIEKTVEDSRFDEFVILNNGITITAQEITVVGDTFSLRGFQIVNGCQTSFVLYNNLAKIPGSKLYVPLKLISTGDEDVTTSVIKATNNQTPIGPEQLAAFSSFQKTLESYYSTYPEETRLYYERRSKQFSAVESVTKSRIITISTQIKAFVAMFLDEPHRVSRYYRTILDSIGKKVFAPGHQPEPYYASALAYYRLGLLFRTGLDTKYKRARYFILMAVRWLVLGEQQQNVSAKGSAKASAALIAAINDPARFTVLVNKAVSIIDSLRLDLSQRDTFRTQSNFDAFVKSLRAHPDIGAIKTKIAAKPSQNPIIKRPVLPVSKSTAKQLAQATTTLTKAKKK